MHCVSGETEILTEKGNKKIENLENKKCKVWNGREYSEVEVRYTGEKELIEVRLSNGKNV